MFEKLKLWQHESHQPDLDYAILGVAALVGGHEEPRNLFIDCLAAYVECGLVEAVNGQIQATEAEMRSDPALLAGWTHTILAMRRMSLKSRLTH